MAHVIAVANQKGGVGKTTTAINLGAALAELGRYTLLADLDPQGGLSLGLGLAAHDLDLTIYNVLTDTRIPVAGISHHLRPHLDLLPSNIDLAVAEVQLVSAMGREYILRDALAAVRDTYEYIILDCPPSLGLLTVNALTAADSLVVPLQVEFFALRGLEALMDVLYRVRRRLNPNLQILGIVPTMVDLRRQHDQRVINEVKQAFPGQVLDIYIKESIKFAEAPARHRTILELDPKHDGSQAYRALARAVLRYYHDLPPEPEPEPLPAPVAEAPEPSVPAPTNGGAPKEEVASLTDELVTPEDAPLAVPPGNGSAPASELPSLDAKVISAGAIESEPELATDVAPPVAQENPGALAETDSFPTDLHSTPPPLPEPVPTGADLRP